MIIADDIIGTKKKKKKKLTLPLSSNFVNMTMTEDICSHIMRQKSSNVSINGPTKKTIWENV